MSDNVHQMEAFRRQNRDQVDALTDRLPPLKDDNGSGKLPPVTKDENLKGRVDLLQALVLLFLAALIGIAVAVMTGFTGTNARIDGAQKSVSELSREVGTVSTKIDESNRRLDRIEQKLDVIADRLPRK